MADILSEGRKAELFRLAQAVESVSDIRRMILERGLEADPKSNRSVMYFGGGVTGARAISKASGYVRIEQTELGFFLNEATQKLNDEGRIPRGSAENRSLYGDPDATAPGIWGEASKQFVEKSKGTPIIFADDTFNADSFKRTTFYGSELPTATHSISIDGLTPVSYTEPEIIWDTSLNYSPIGTFSNDNPKFLHDPNSGLSEAQISLVYAGGNFSDSLSSFSLDQKKADQIGRPRDGPEGQTPPSSTGFMSSQSAPSDSPPEETTLDPPINEGLEETIWDQRNRDFAEQTTIHSIDVDPQRSESVLEPAFSSEGDSTQTDTPIPPEEPDLEDAPEREITQQAEALISKSDQDAQPEPPLNIPPDTRQENTTSTPDTLPNTEQEMEATAVANAPPPKDVEIVERTQPSDPSVSQAASEPVEAVDVASRFPEPTAQFEGQTSSEHQTMLDQAETQTPPPGEVAEVETESTQEPQQEVAGEAADEVPTNVQATPLAAAEALSPGNRALVDQAEARTPPSREMAEAEAENTQETQREAAGETTDEAPADVQAPPPATSEALSPEHQALVDQAEARTPPSREIAESKAESSQVQQEAASETADEALANVQASADADPMSREHQAMDDQAEARTPPSRGVPESETEAVTDEEQPQEASSEAESGASGDEQATSPAEAEPLSPDHQAIVEQAEARIPPSNAEPEGAIGETLAESPPVDEQPQATDEAQAQPNLKNADLTTEPQLAPEQQTVEAESEALVATSQSATETTPEDSQNLAEVSAQAAGQQASPQTATQAQPQPDEQSAELGTGTELSAEHQAMVAQAEARTPPSRDAAEAAATDSQADVESSGPESDLAAPAATPEPTLAPEHQAMVDKAEARTPPPPPPPPPPAEAQSSGMSM